MIVKEGESMLPEKLLIAAHQVDVRIERLDDVWGKAFPGKLEILLSDDISPRFQLTVLWHEILHIVSHLYSVFDDDEEEERKIQTLATAISQVLTQNRKLTQVFLDSAQELG